MNMKCPVHKSDLETELCDITDMEDTVHSRPLAYCSQCDGWWTESQSNATRIYIDKYKQQTPLPLGPDIPVIGC